MFRRSSFGRLSFTTSKPPHGSRIFQINKEGIASFTEGLEKNQDGSVDIYFGPKAPKGKETNWLPTVPGKKFFLIFRFYRPEPSLFNKSWKLNDVEKPK